MQLAQHPWLHEFPGSARAPSAPCNEPPSRETEIAARARSSARSVGERPIALVDAATLIGERRLDPRTDRRVATRMTFARVWRSIVRTEVEPDEEALAAGDDLEPRTRSELMCRALNLALAALCLALLLPLLLLLALGVKLSSRGPVLYTQSRVGLDRRWRRTLHLRDRRRVDLGGKAFTIYKFRSMRSDAESSTGAVWARAHDPRVTPFGRFLRKYHLDELPQLVNVVRGDMNFVGPRPERPSIAAQLRADIQGYALRQRVKPGITGLAQIHLRYDASIDDVRRKVRYDVVYLQRQSLWLDLWILLRTAPAVLSSARGW
jgi:lipopolysaccharide/colanic/teichoic acid biosynthesis glycosyltransferase